MKTIKLFLLGCIFLGGTNTVYSQSTINDDVAHRRYWYYRTRLINDFIKIGKNQGECIMIAERSEPNLPDPNGIHMFKIGPDQIDLTNMYMATLALEFKLLSRNNQNTDETIKEIFHLMYAINRLDLEAEYFWNTPLANLQDEALVPSGSRNGYMLREDHYSKFIKENENIGHFNYELYEKGYNGITRTTMPDDSLLCKGFSGIRHINEEDYDRKVFKAIKDPNNNPKADASLVHDKYYSMLAAFMFIVKYIPSNTFYFENGVPQAFQDGTFGIKEQAIAITNAMHPYMQGNIFDPNPSNDWVLKQPDGTNIGFFNGAGATQHSFTSHRAICHINNGFPWAWTDNCFAFSDPVAGTAGVTAYDAIGNIPSINQDNAVFIAWNQAFSNFPVTVLGSPVGCRVAMSANTSFWDLQWAELAREVLFETNPTIVSSMSTIENPLAVAPCEGPSNFGNSEGGPEWSGQDRTEHPDVRGGSNFLGHYPGVDFMFLHNLFYEYLNQQNLSGQYNNAVSLMDNYDEQTWPLHLPTLFPLNPMVPNITYGISGNQLNAKVFQYLSSRAQIYATASPLAPNNVTPSHVEYRAGKQIELLPENSIHAGFKVDEGSEFSAVVKRYVCSQGDYGNGLRTSDNPNVSVDDYETDGMNTSVPMHYVQNQLSASDLYEKKQAEVVSSASNRSALMNKPGMFEIIPNPSNGQFKIICSGTESETFTLAIYDLHGRLILEEKEYVSHDFDFSDRIQGMYLVKLSSNLGSNSTKKLSIIR